MTNIYEGKKGVVLFLICLVLGTIIYVQGVKEATIKQLNSTDNQIRYESK